MSTFTARSFDFSDINNNTRYENGDTLQPEALNRVIEGCKQALNNGGSGATPYTHFLRLHNVGGDEWFFTFKSSSSTAISTLAQLNNAIPAGTQGYRQYGSDWLPFVITSITYSDDSGVINGWQIANGVMSTTSENIWDYETVDDTVV